MQNICNFYISEKNSGNAAQMTEADLTDVYDTTDRDRDSPGSQCRCRDLEDKWIIKISIIYGQ